MDRPLLLDTNALIFYLFQNALSKRADEAVRNTPDVFISVASLWEIAIKQSIRKLEINSTISDIANACNSVGISIMGIKPEHLDYISRLPNVHSDPFDRLIISQAVTEGMTLISSDTVIPRYCTQVDGLQIIW